ncbi:TorD/DmsD family molecular chaperone [Parvibacter caecicola]|uniref:TorD/DmsD family molecular chaperone n=1 Tax=Parvibacter caecicola TaxID=747645 RepID=UPI0023F00B70|nr:molecular chaperone TorD family protein [Parvibacter caecicola]
MDANEIEVARGRAQAYRMLASVFFKELDEGQIASLREAELPSGQSAAMAEAAAEIRRAIRLAPPNVLSLLRIDYARIFLAAGVYEGDTAVPYESVFTSEDGLMMQEARDDVLEYYRAEGLEIEASLQTPEDHIAFELEFLALLCDRMAAALEANDGAEAVRLASVQREFAKSHVLNWAGALAKRVDNYAEEAFYPAFIRYAIAFVEDDVASLEELIG